MIINTGGRTDTVQYYTKWLLRRFSAGYVPVSYTHLDVYKRQDVNRSLC